MDPTEALTTLHNALPADPDDHGPVAAPSDAIRAISRMAFTSPRLTCLCGRELLIGYEVPRSDGPHFFCDCGARMHAVDIRQAHETLRFPESYVPGDHIDPCSCETFDPQRITPKAGA